MRRIFLLMIFIVAVLPSSTAQTTVKKVVLQAFWWDYYNTGYNDKWANYLCELAPRLKAMGVDAIWIPPTSKNQSPYYVGYSPFDHYDLGDKFQKGALRTRLGSKDELLRMIAVMHANGIEVIQDVVLNHINAAGSSTGAGGIDPNSFSMATEGGYKNFRYVSYSTPANTETQTAYWNRSGRWPKNYTNFYPNQYNNCTSGDICSSYFGPDVSYESTAFGQSSNVAGFNPAQSSNYMRNEARNWIMWMKKQTGVDGFRWDAAKHFPTYVQEDLSYNAKYTLPSWCSGGQNMFNVGEYVGSKTELDNYVNAIAAPSGEKMMGTFDFGLRGYDPAGGLYGMAYGLGNFDMATLLSAQQNERVAYYSSSNTYVHRTVPFVNNHDTFRPQLNAQGNYSGWNSGSELSPHIEPSEPRLSAAYAVIMAMDGNPQLFFEDLFDIGYSGNRYNHDPKSSSSLPARSDLINLLWCHQALNFKTGPYNVSFSNADYLVIARAGKALIGVTDSWSNWQNQWVYTYFAPGTVLKDYSGANGNATVTVNADGWAQINTPPVNPALNIAGRRGYSVWAPVGLDGTVYNPPRALSTTQEWEMANDLGDSHVNSLGQGGAIPASSTNFRTAGKIFVEQGKEITYNLYPQNSTKSLYIGLYNPAGNLLSSKSGLGSQTGYYTPNFTGWITIKVRNSVNTNPSQKCWVNVSYTAPAVVTNANALTSANTASFWTGNGGSDNWFDAQNWEEGRLPDDTTDVVIPANAFPQPTMHGEAFAHRLNLESGARLTVYGDLFVSEINSEDAVTGQGALILNGVKITLNDEHDFVFTLSPNPSSDDFQLLVNGNYDVRDVLNAEVYNATGQIIARTTGDLMDVERDLNIQLADVHSGVYLLRLTGRETSVLRMIRE